MYYFHVIVIWIVCNFKLLQPTSYDLNILIQLWNLRARIYIGDILHIYIYVCIYMHMYKYTYIHTHIDE